MISYLYILSLICISVYAVNLKIIIIRRLSNTSEPSCFKKPHEIILTETWKKSSYFLVRHISNGKSPYSLIFYNTFVGSNTLQDDKLVFEIIVKTYYYMFIIRRRLAVT